MLREEEEATVAGTQWEREAGTRSHRAPKAEKWSAGLTLNAVGRLRNLLTEPYRISPGWGFRGRTKGSS